MPQFDQPVLNFMPVTGFMELLYIFVCIYTMVEPHFARLPDTRNVERQEGKRTGIHMGKLSPELN